MIVYDVHERANTSPTRKRIVEYYYINNVKYVSFDEWSALQCGSEIRLVAMYKQGRAVDISVFTALDVFFLAMSKACCTGFRT